MKEIVIPVDSEMLHVVYMCIIEHWRMPEYEEKFNGTDFQKLKNLREQILKLRDEKSVTELKISKDNLHILIGAYEIGFGELIKAQDFETIVGESIMKGKFILTQLKSYL